MINLKKWSGLLFVYLFIYLFIYVNQMYQNEQVVELNCLLLNLCAHSHSNSYQKPMRSQNSNLDSQAPKHPNTQLINSQINWHFDHNKDYSF